MIKEKLSAVFNRLSTRKMATLKLCLGMTGLVIGVATPAALALTSGGIVTYFAACDLLKKPPKI